jgi:hypothetical protein
MDTTQQLEVSGKCLTKRILSAERSGNQALVDRLLKLKNKLNHRKAASYVIGGYQSGKNLTAQS